MKNSIQLIPSQICFALVAVLTFGGFQSAPASDRYWSSTTSGAQTDGSGNWETASTWLQAAGGSTHYTWASGDAAYIGNGGTAGTITLGAAQTVNGITFKAVAGNYLVTGSTITLGSTTTPITVNDDAAEISSVIAGSANTLNKLGTGMLTLSGANTYVRWTALRIGTIVFNSIQKVGSSTANALGKQTTAGYGTITCGADGAATLRFNGSTAGTSDRAIGLGGAAGNDVMLDGSGTVALILRHRETIT
jgi:autotransporter-associated beta strand protein